MARTLRSKAFDKSKRDKRNAAIQAQLRQC